MCGIAGYYGQFDSGILEKMSETISYRGPDDHGEKVLKHKDLQVGLAHRRLSIIDLSAEGHQPMTTSCSCCPKDLWLTYNGEIYNYRELRDDLIKKGHRFHSETDSEVLLHLYAEYGPEMLKQLNGMFAFALYDGRQGNLLVARDGLGVKPLYYSQAKQGFLFASELKAISASGCIEREINLSAMHQYLAYQWCPAPNTALKTVKKMQPGEAMIVRAGAIVKQWCFYDLPYQNKKLDLSEKEIAETLAEQIKSAVDRQLVADVPVAAFLSGGLDSSAIVAMMRQLRPEEKLRCYTIGFDEKKTEGSPADLPYARQVAKALNVDLKEIILDANMMDYLPKLIYQLDEPQADPAPINAWIIAARARADGYKVLLSGAGGDDVFSGYRRHYALQLEKYWRWMPQLARSGLAKWARHDLEQGALLPIMKKASVRRAAKLFSYADLSGDERLASYFLWSSEGLRHSLYSKDVSLELEKENALTPLLNNLQTLPAGLSELEKMLYLEGRYFLPDHNLNYTDKVSMAHSMEVRVPLIDQKLVDYATRIPVQFKQQGKTGKAIFKKAMEPYLPRNVVYRPKTGFAAPLRRWLHQDLQPLLHDTLSETSLKRRGLFDPTSVQRLISLDAKGRVDAAYPLFGLVCMELWCRQFLDKI